MPDIESELSIRRRIGQCEQDMKRAAERSTDALTNFRRATILADTPAQIDLDLVEAAMQDLKAARVAFLAAIKEKRELESRLGVA